MSTSTRNKLLMSPKQTQALYTIFGNELSMQILSENLTKTLQPILSKILKVSEDLKSIEERISSFENKSLMDSFYKSNGQPSQGWASNFYGIKK